MGGWHPPGGWPCFFRALCRMELAPGFRFIPFARKNDKPLGFSVLFPPPPEHQASGIGGPSAMGPKAVGNHLQSPQLAFNRANPPWRKTPSLNPQVPAGWCAGARRANVGELSKGAFSEVQSFSFQIRSGTSVEETHAWADPPQILTQIPLGNVYSTSPNPLFQKMVW